MGHMRCRTIVKENDIKNIVWFGSYGKEVLAPEQIKFITYNVTNITGTIEGQNFEMDVFPYRDTTILFYGENDALLDSVDVKQNIKYKLTGTLLAPLIKISLSHTDFYSNPKLTLKEYANAKKAYILDISENAASKGDKQVESNFSNDLQAIVDDLTQKLSVMRTELWHYESFGLPLLEKVKSKALIDSAVADILMQQNGVIGISKFSSSIIQKEYHCEIEIQTNLGNVTISM